MSTEVKVETLPNCDICKQNGKDKKAKYDARTIFGAWGNLCEIHFKQFGVGLGTGKGQKLILKQGE